MPTQASTSNASTVVFAAVQFMSAAITRPLAAVHGILRTLVQDIDPNDVPKIGTM